MMATWLPAGVRNADRRRELRREAERLAELLAARGARQVVLFGSTVADDNRPVDDIDLLVVVETDVPFAERAARLLVELASREAVDLLVYTPAELAELRERSGFVRRALATGIVLHAEPSR